MKPNVLQRPRTKRPASNGGSPSATPSSRLAALPRRRRPPLAVLGAFLVVVGALGALLAVKSVSDRQSVLVAANEIPAGHLIKASDLRVADVSSSGLDLVPSASESTVIGRPAAVGIPAGAPIVGADVGSPPAATQGHTVVAVLVKDGQYPPALAPGDHVGLVDTGSTAAAGIASRGTDLILQNPVAAVVLSVDNPSGATASAASGTVVTVQVGDADAAAVARAAAAGRVDILLVAVH